MSESKQENSVARQASGGIRFFMRNHKLSFLIIFLIYAVGCSSSNEPNSAGNRNDVSATSPQPYIIEDTPQAASNDNRASTAPPHVINDAVNNNQSKNANAGSMTNSETASDAEKPVPGKIDSPDENLVKRIKYSQLSDVEKISFIQQRMNHIAFLIANEKYYFNTKEDQKAIRIIKYWIDELQKRVGNGNGNKLWSGDLNLLFSRGKKYAPVIIQAAKKENVPEIVPLYIAAIETEYTNVSTQNHAGAAGLFQFIPSTARLYGINPSERTNIPIMADAAVRYISDRMKEFGNDTRSVTLCIAGYNRNPDNVRRDLHAVLEMKDSREKERSFWTMIENEEGLINTFGEKERKYYKENMPYVPRFFAFAIMGETPWAFGIDLDQALSTFKK